MADSYCCQKKKSGMKRRVFRVLPHVVCSNCGGYLISAHAHSCPACEIPIDYRGRREMVMQPVKLEVVGVI